jgi:amino acid transporter
VNAWIVGPVKGLYATTMHGNLPPVFHKLNKHGVPTNLLLFQGVIVSISSCVFLFMPSLSSSFWILTALSAQTYLMMYVLMFIAAIRLRYKKPKVERTYRVPFGNKGMWVAGVTGIAASLFAFLIAFVPPGQLEVGSLLFYESFLIIGVVIMSGIPLIIHQYRKGHWIKK